MDLWLCLLSFCPLLTTTKRLKLDVPQDELTSLNVELNGRSSTGLWPKRLQLASEDPRKVTSLLSTILNDLLYPLAKTTAKDNFISPWNVQEVETFIEGFNPVALQELFLTTLMIARLQPVAITPNKAHSSCVSKCFCWW